MHGVWWKVHHIFDPSSSICKLSPPLAFFKIFFVFLVCFFVRYQNVKMAFWGGQKVDCKARPLHIYEVCPESIQHVLWKIETFIEEDTRYKKRCTQDNDASVSFKVGTWRPHTVLPITISCPIVVSWNSSMVWNLFPFKGDFSFGKSQKSQGAKSGS